MNPEKIGNILKLKRKTLSYSVKYVLDKLSAKGIDIKQSTLYGYENNQNIPDAHTLMALCEIYNIENALSEFGYRQKKPIFQSKRLEYIIKVTNRDDIMELSAQAGVDVMTFTSWLNGKVQPPYEKIELLASFLGITCDYLMGLTDDPEASIKNDEELSMPFDTEERIHLKKYNSLNDANRQVIDTTIDAMLATQDAKKRGDIAAKNGEKESEEVSKNVG